MAGSSGGGGSQTVTNVSTPPQYVQDQATKNIGIANDLASQPYPQYQGQLYAPQNNVQTGAQNMAFNASTAYTPGLANATATTDNALATSPVNAAALGPNPLNPAATNATNPFNSNLALNNQNIAQYMNPYVMQSLAPQLQAAQQNLANQQLQTNAQATQANAFGDARQGVQNSLNNYYGNQTMAGIVGQGMNQAYNTALNTGMTEQNLGLSEQGVAQGQQNLGLQQEGINQGQENLGLSQRGQNLAGGAQQANLAGLSQSLGLKGANAVQDVGNIQQNNTQTANNLAYQQYLNQTQWPYQMLNLRESAITNNPYSTQNNITLPQSNSFTNGLGAFTNLAGQLGSLSSGGGGSSAPFG